MYNMEYMKRFCICGDKVLKVLVGKQCKKSTYIVKYKMSFHRAGSKKSEIIDKSFMGGNYEIY